MIQKKKDYIDLFSTALLIIILLILIYFLILKILGYSPVDIAVIYSFIIALIINSFRFENKLGKLDEFSETTKNSFKFVRKDMNEMKININEIKTDINGIKVYMSNTKKDITKIKNKLRK